MPCRYSQPQQAGGLPVLPAAHYERLMAYLEDLEDAKLLQERASGPFIEVSLDEL
jgi:antitoxin StbD